MQGPKFEVFPGVDSQFYWHLRARNGQVVAGGGESFTSRGAAEGGTKAATAAVLAISADVAGATAEAKEGEEPLAAPLIHLETAPDDAAILNKEGTAATA